MLVQSISRRRRLQKSIFFADKVIWIDDQLHCMLYFGIIHMRGMAL